MFQLLLISAALTELPPQAAVRAADRTWHFRGETQAGPVQVDGVGYSSVTPGSLVAPRPFANKVSWQFNGTGAIVYLIPSNSDGFAENFTWEGFFLSPASNRYLAETGIADRLVTQFAFDKGDWTRLAVGLAAGSDGAPRLCVELEGFEGRSFGMGSKSVSPDRWHHFALVHEGTASAARIVWYLDYEAAGQLLLGGQSNQNTLRPPGAARFTVGARLKHGKLVNRGFEGFVDEIRLVPRNLSVGEFLRCDALDSEAPVVSGAALQRRREAYWQSRHRWASRESRRWATRAPSPSSIDRFFDRPSQAIDDASFLRRLSLTLRGRIPNLDEALGFLQDDRPDRRTRVIDRFLASTEWADSWVGYWQDVLAENPSVVFPTLNNSGAFRKFIYDSFRDDKPFDRFVTELILMEKGAGGDGDGPAGFGLATGNDVPAAMRAHVALKAFAAVDLKCARCHDSPLDRFRQSDLFLIAAYLKGGPLEVPATSLAALDKATDSDLIVSSLRAGQIIRPVGLRSHWLQYPEETRDLRPFGPGPRAELAALITSPRNSRFSDVVANRVWKRYFGSGLIEPVDRWNDRHEPSRPPLLRFLSGKFVASGYDLKAVAKLIVDSDQWQSNRKRTLMSAEQLVDSLFIAVGKGFQAETLGVHATDPGAVQLPAPRRAWQFAALPNERDRPALGMPVNQTIVDVMTTFGWNGNRQQPRSEREQSISPLGPLMLLNGLVSQRIVGLTEQSAITRLCLQELPVSTFVERLFLTLLGRFPNLVEQRAIVALLSPGYENRGTGRQPLPFEPLNSFQPDWRRHLEPEQSQLMFAAQRRVAHGEPATVRLTEDFRERVEDVVWALINSPEFIVIP